MKKGRIAALCLALSMVTGMTSGCAKTTVSGTAAQESGAAETTIAMTTGAAVNNTAAEDWSSYKTADGKTFIRVGIDADPGTMDPFVSGSQNGKNATIKSSLYQYLGMIQGVGGELAPELAKSWEKTGDTVWDIELFDYIHDWNGNNITAEDVVFSYEQAKANNYSNMKYVESIEATGDYTVKLTLNSSAKTLFERIMQGTVVVSKKAYEESSDNMSTDACFTGPYKLVEWVSGSSLVIEKWDDYWQNEEEAKKDINQTANVDRIEFYVIKEASQMAIALETGKIDMVYNLDATEAERFMDGGGSSDGFNVFTTVNNLTQTMFLNVDNNSPFYENLPLRQAVLYSFDSQGMVDGASGGYGVVCKTFGGDELPDFQEAWREEDYYEYNPEKAKELLKEAGYGEGELSLRIVTNNSSMRNKIAQILQAYLLQVGIKSEILPYDDTLFNTYKNDSTQWDILLDNCGTSDELIGMWRGKMDSTNFVNGTANFAHDDELQRLVLLAINTDTNSPETVNDLHQYMKDQAYVYGMYNNLAFTICRDVVTDVSMNSTPWLMPAGCTYVWNEK
ncbi:hypothetical protein C0033_03325 [Clostridium sp. chh4-2]|uniref:ABC transporter substrate-binding protein n=1 Tax=Clostridium sp. chh4-2 TaxID=2067550 RepID=UPI000CCF601F|nr:ABC transporter substrate-binding protein [Clostridium sp. chh4-2]PNV63692.1 hypothetical protein C0033_03325 [Clostridium sp. chh4-2]